MGITLWDPYMTPSEMMQLMILGTCMGDSLIEETAPMVWQFSTQHEDRRSWPRGRIVNPQVLRPPYEV